MCHSSLCYHQILRNRNYDCQDHIGDYPCIHRQILFRVDRLIQIHSNHFGSYPMNEYLVLSVLYKYVERTQANITGTFLDLFLPRLAFAARSLSLFNRLLPPFGRPIGALLALSFGPYLLYCSLYLK